MHPHCRLEREFLVPDVAKHPLAQTFRFEEDGVRRPGSPHQFRLVHGDGPSALVVRGYPGIVLRQVDDPLRQDGWLAVSRIELANMELAILS